MDKRSSSDRPAPPDAPRGRGAAGAESGRFERLRIEPDPEADPAENPSPRTEFYKETSRTILTYNDSEDIRFEVSLNPYRGCEHGCSYCYARPYHEYVGLSPGLDFETKILVKTEAPELLRKELMAKSWKPKPVAMSGVTDCYQPVERRLKLTRRCLEVFLEFRNPVLLITKNHLIERDADILGELAKHRCVAASLSITSLDGELQRRLEPRTSHPTRRLKAIEALAKAGVPVGVMAAPMIPGLNDHELPAILKAAADHGAKFAGYVPLRLPYSVKDLFQEWLEREEPGRKAKVLSQIRDLRGGALNDPNFGSRFRGKGVYAEQLEALFQLGARMAGLGGWPNVSTEAFRRPSGPQLELFGEA